MQGVVLNLVTVGSKGITSPGKIIPAMAMHCNRPYGEPAGIVARSLDGKFRKWNPVIQVAKIT